jgi:hypothetical protein
VKRVKQISPKIDPKKLALMVTAMLGALHFLGAIAGFSQVPSHQTTMASPLMSRVGPPSADTVNEFTKAGMENVSPHELTAEERASVNAALDRLPPLNRNALLTHLHQLAFVDGIPGEGSGLTSPAKGGYFDITLRASLIHESLSTFLTTKERRVFIDDGTETTVTVTATGTDALTYVLLHESSHVLDAACSIIKTVPNTFDRGIWLAEHQLHPDVATLVATQTYFHGGAKLPSQQASKVYDSLSNSPFVSLYATASAREDFAELVAWREIQKLYAGTLTIRVDQGHAAAPREWHPLSFTAAQRRFLQVDQLESLKEGCPIGDNTHLAP